MRMTGFVHVFLAALVAGMLSSMESLSAQVLSARTTTADSVFNGTLSMRGPLEFVNCTFVTDSVVLDYADGALFSNCSFESRSGKLYIANCGSGIILSDCNVYGADTLIMSRRVQEQDRHYILNVMVNGTELTVPDNCSTILKMEGTELEYFVKGKQKGPVFVRMVQDRLNLHAKETATLKLEGLDTGMFVGWLLDDSCATLDIDRSYGEFACCVTAPDTIECSRYVYVTAFTEYGSEAVACLRLVPYYKEEPVQEKRRKCRLFRRKRKRE